jgi:hypothetical protein
MDPQENLRQQCALAHEIHETMSDGIEDFEAFLYLAEELATLVLTLNAWRLQGGYDPYTQKAAS